MGTATDCTENKAKRIQSIDQLRGYAIFGMILVNYLGKFPAIPEAFKHHRDLGDYPPFGFSYADTVAPLFMFVVGMGFRLSFQRHVDTNGLWPARGAAIKRYTILILLGTLLYGSEFQWIWDALVDIGFAGLLALPFILGKGPTRMVVAVAYMVLYQFLYMSPQFWTHCITLQENLPPWASWFHLSQVTDFTTYGEWTINKSIDGGPLGPISWVFCLLLGTIAYDLMATKGTRTIFKGCIAWGIGLCALGYLLRLQWGDFKTPWYFTQYGMSAPYPIASTGLCFLTLALFYFTADIKGFNVPTLSILGINALAIYCLQLLLLNFGGTFVDRQSAIPMALFGFTLFYLCNYAVAFGLHKKNIIIRL